MVLTPPEMQQQSAHLRYLSTQRGRERREVFFNTSKGDQCVVFGKGDESATTVSFTATTNDTPSYDASTGVLNVKLLSLVNEASSQPGLSGISTAIGSAATFCNGYRSPLIDENGMLLRVDGKLNIADRDHTPYISTLSDQAATEDGSAITGKITADAEGIPLVTV